MREDEKAKRSKVNEEEKVLIEIGQVFVFI